MQHPPRQSNPPTHDQEQPRNRFLPFHFFSERERGKKVTRCVFANHQQSHPGVNICPKVLKLSVQKSTDKRLFIYPWSHLIHSHLLSNSLLPGCHILRTHLTAMFFIDVLICDSQKRSADICRSAGSAVHLHRSPGHYCTFL